MSAPTRCPNCDRALDANGLCPACLLQAGLSPSESSAQMQTTPFEPKFIVPTLAELIPHFPQLEIIEQLGQGGMGAVYTARQIRLDRLVALKVLPKQTSQEREFANRFAREARAMARLSHPNIVNIHDYGEAGGWFFFIMEFVDGVNLRQAIHNKTVEPKEALSIVGHICDALQYAHDEGVVHRDIKPENILLDKRGRVKIADFGLAKVLGFSTQNHRLTATNQVMGTVGYMAPEQMEGSKEVDHRADIYALGVVFYELLTGELPMGRFAPPSQKVQVDVRIDEVVLKTLEKEPDRRYQFASQVKQDVERISKGGVDQKSHLHSSVWWKEPTCPGLALLVLGLISLILLFVGIWDSSGQEYLFTNNQIWDLRHGRLYPFAHIWIILAIVGLALGAGVGMLTGALMLSRRSRFLAILGALLAVLPLTPIGFFLQPYKSEQEQQLAEWMQIARERGMKLIPTPPLLERWPVLLASLLEMLAGVWALLLLLRPEVKAQFQGSLWSLLGAVRRGLRLVFGITSIVARPVFGIISFVFIGMGTGFLVWITAGVIRHEVIPESLISSDKHPVLILCSLGAALLLVGMMILVFIRRSVNRRPWSPILRGFFIVVAIMFYVLAAMFLLLIGITSERGESLATIFAPMIRELSEGIGWGAAFLSGATMAIILARKSVANQ